MDYRVPAHYGQAEFIEKRSRFIGQVWPVSSEFEARELILSTKATFHDARHNCWCYIIREENGIEGRTVVRYADDGEPQGTAGQPMLEVFRRGGIENVLCIVTRYFGGILLGAGGLTRAYANTSKLALDQAEIAEMSLWSRVEMFCPYHLFDRIKKEIDISGGIVETIDYASDISIIAIFPESASYNFVDRIQELSAGSINAVISGEIYRA